ncbi:hypothetical protein BVRB_7g164200 [Beta vulgaris subsp. vulgaris]|nr:hypothetical protein BVRB_7g164200 [Beta vulgaris subsp. vulgaris]
MSLIELWEATHKRKDGTYLEGTYTSDFLENAKAKVDSLKLCNPSMPCVNVENETFQTVMNGHEIPERPKGYGFGVKKSDIHGVRSMLRKEGNGKLKRIHVELENIVETSLLKKRNEELEKQNKEISKKFDEHTNMMKTVATHFSLVLDAVRDGKASAQLIDVVKSSMHLITAESLIEILKMSFGFSHSSKDDIPSDTTYSCSEYPYCELGNDCEGIHSFSPNSRKLRGQILSSISEKTEVIEDLANGSEENKSAETLVLDVPKSEKSKEDVSDDDGDEHAPNGEISDAESAS